MHPSRPISGQQDGERGALAAGGIDADASAVLLDDAVADRKAQAGALADFLGSEKGLENFLQALFWLMVLLLIGFKVVFVNMKL